MSPLAPQNNLVKWCRKLTTALPGSSLKDKWKGWRRRKRNISDDVKEICERRRQRNEEWLTRQSRFVKINLAEGCIAWPHPHVVFRRDQSINNIDYCLYTNFLQHTNFFPCCCLLYCSPGTFSFHYPPNYFYPLAMLFHRTLWPPKLCSNVLHTLDFTLAPVRFYQHPPCAAAAAPLLLLWVTGLTILPVMSLGCWAAACGWRRWMSSSESLSVSPLFSESLESV